MPGEGPSFLHEIAEVCDECELSGPIGGWFFWDGSVPAICVAGGAGVVPIVSMMRYARRIGAQSKLAVVASAQFRDALPYVDEIEQFGATR